MSLSLAKAIASVDKLIEQLERGAFINQVGQSSGGSTKSTKQVVKQQPKQLKRNVSEKFLHETHFLQWEHGNQCSIEIL